MDTNIRIVPIRQKQWNTRWNHWFFLLPIAYKTAPIVYEIPPINRMNEAGNQPIDLIRGKKEKTIIQPMQI